MNGMFIKMSLILTLCLFVTVSFSQTEENKWSVGLNVGGQKLYGDITNVSIGLGAEGLVAYKVLKFLDLSFALGYSQLKYKGLFNTTDIINTDIKGNFEVYSKGMFRPYLTLGIGLLNAHVGKTKGRFWEESVFGGGGVRVKLSSQFDGMLGADYRFTTGDAFDAVVRKAKDGYLNVRAGVNYHLSKQTDSEQGVIANERAPLFEVGDERSMDDFSTERPANREAETKNMEEYVKLKSRIDALSQNVDSKESEIERLQSNLSNRKQQVASMEMKASRQPSKSMQKNSSMSGFSEIYKEALAHYYNKNYSEANSLFQVLLQQYPRHSLASNCQYWIAQGLLAMNRFDESIAAFNKVLNYERSLKKDDSLFLLGKTYLKTGSGEKAKQSFNRLLQEYPGSEFAQEARDYIAKL